MLESRENEKVSEELKIENMQEFKRAVQSVAASPHGRFVFQVMLRFMGWSTPPTRDQMTMLERQGMRRMYTSLFRPCLEPETRKEVEDI